MAAAAAAAASARQPLAQQQLVVVQQLLLGCLAGCGQLCSQGVVLQGAVVAVVLLRGMAVVVQLVVSRQAAEGD